MILRLSINAGDRLMAFLSIGTWVQASGYGLMKFLFSAARQFNVFHDEAMLGVGINVVCEGEREGGCQRGN